MEGENLKCFENVENSMLQVKLNCILTMHFWCNQLYLMILSFSLMF